MAYVSVKATADANSYQKTMKSMAQEAKALASQWTATQAKAKAFGSQTDILNSKAGALSEKIKLQKEIVKLAGDQYEKLSTKLLDQKTKHDELKAKVDAAKKALEESAQATGKNSKETKKLKDELTKLETELKTSENSINQTEVALNKQAIAANNAETKLSEMEEELKAVNKELRDHKLDAFADGCDKAGQKLEAFGQKMMVVSAGIAAFATTATKMAVDFEDSIAKVSTIMDTGQLSVGEMEDAIVSLSNETGIAAGNIADNVYNAISAGRETKDAVDFVRQSTKLATAGFAESGDTLDLLTTILNAYGLEAEQVANVSDMLIQTQNLGKTTVAELSSAMGKVIPTANANSVALDQLCTGYAIMTANGVATAETTTYVNAMLNELGKTGSKTDKILREKTGKSFKELMAEGASLADVLAIVDDAAKEQNLSMGDMFSSSEAAKAGLILFNGSADAFNSTLGQMRESTGATDTAFDKMKTTSYDIKLALNELKNTTMQFGQTILTSATPMIEGFTENVGTLCEWFRSLDEGQQQTIIKVGLFVAAIAPASVAIGKMGQGIKTTVNAYKTMRDIIPKVIAKLAGKTAATVADTAAETASTVVSTANTTAITAGTAATIAHTVAAKAAAAGQWLLNAAMSANPIGIVILAIAGLVAGFVAMYNNSETLRNAVNKLWTTVKDAFRKFASKMAEVKTAVMEKLAAVKTAFSNVLAKCSEDASNAFNTIKNIITVAFMVIREIINAAVAIITLPFRFIWENCKDVVIKVWDAIKEKIETAINNVKTVISTVMTAIKKVISSVWEAIKIKVQSVLDGIKTIIMTVWTTIKTNVTTILNAIRGVINAVWTTIKTNVTTVFNAIKMTTTSIWNDIKSTVSNAINTAKTTVSTAVNTIKTTVSNVFTALKNTVTTVWNGIKSAIETPINAAKTAVQNAINAMKNAFNFSWSLPKIKLPHFSISGSFSLKPPSVPHFSVDWYKTGGIMTNPTVFGINGNSLMVGGEAGDEAILPLAEFYNKLNRILDKKLDAVLKSNIVYVTNHTYIDGDEVASKTVSKVDEKMVTDKRKGR